MYDLSTIKKMNTKAGAAKIHALARATNKGSKKTPKRVDKPKP